MFDNFVLKKFKNRTHGLKISLTEQLKKILNSSIYTRLQFRWNLKQNIFFMQLI